MLKPFFPTSSSTPLSRLLVQQHYVLGSLAVHAALALGLVVFLDGRKAESTLQANQGRISAHLHKAQQANLYRKVDHLKAMQELMERIDKAQREGELPNDETETPPQDLKDPIKDRPDLTPQQTLEKARALLDRIQQMEKKARAQELARALKIPDAEALKQVQQAAPNDVPPEADSPKNDAEVAQTLERYEQLALAAVERRRLQEERQVNGSKIQIGQPHDAGTRGTASSPTASDGDGSLQNGRTGTSPNASYARAANDSRPESRQYTKPLQPVAVRLQDLRLGHGNAIGAGAPLANRVVIDRWYVIGPFAATDKSSMKTIYPPEMLVDLDGVYLGKGARVLQWQYLSAPRYPLVPPEPVATAIYFGYTEIRSDSDRDVWMALGADDDAKLWVNDKLVWNSGNAFKPWYNRGGFSVRTDDIQNENLIEERRLVHLKKGRNTVMFKLYNGILDLFMTVAIEPS